MAEAETAESKEAGEPTTTSTDGASSEVASADASAAPDSTSTVISSTTTTAESTAGETPKITGTASGEPDYLVGAKVDLAFVLDTTGSMGSYIASACQSINDIAANIKKEKIDVRFAFIPYKDHSDTPLTEVTDFTEDNLAIKKHLDKQIASGGGDGPEAVGTGLFDARYKLSWRDDASKVIILIADAPPHGLEDGGDTYPNECPMTGDRRKLIGVKDKHIDILKLIRAEIRDELEATIYTVACEPSVSCSYTYCRDFMMFAAECTDGKFLPLTKADLLPATIIGSVKQQIAMDALENKLDETMEQIKKEYADAHEGKEPTDEEMDDLLTKKFQESGVEIEDIDVGELYVTPPSRVNVELLLNDQECPTLKDFKAKRQSISRMDQSNLKFLPTRGGGGGGISFVSRSSKRMSKKKKSRRSSPARTEKRAITSEALDFSSLAMASSPPSAAPLASSASALSAAPRVQTVTMSRKAVSRDTVMKSRAKQSRKKAYRASKMS